MALKAPSKDPSESLRLFQGICKVSILFIIIRYLPFFKLILPRV